MHFHEKIRDEIQDTINEFYHTDTNSLFYCHCFTSFCSEENREESDSGSCTGYCSNNG